MTWACLLVGKCEPQPQEQHKCLQIFRQLKIFLDALAAIPALSRGQHLKNLKKFKNYHQSFFV